MAKTEAQVELFRRQIQRILMSSEFAHSRQLRDYLAFVSEAAFEGRTHLEQIEIAAGVLHRGTDFNPVDDASVRKLATLLRQKLDRYYSSEGGTDEVKVVLPTRSYIPLFEILRQPETEPVTPPQVPEKIAPRTVVPAGQTRFAAAWIGLGSVAIAFLIAAAGGGLFEKRADSGLEPQFVFRTTGGDIMHRENNLPPAALRLGPAVGPYDHVTVRMKFSPERATQQAGVLIFVNEDEYVKLGRQFNSRAQLEFGVETGGTYRKPTGTFVYDATGQNGEPIWLSIRRNRSKFTAWISANGADWKKFGNDLELPGEIEPRVALFGHNGRADAPSTSAVFDRLSIGTEFRGLDTATAPAEALAGWRNVLDPDGPVPFLEPASLVYPISLTFAVKA